MKKKKRLTLAQQDSVLRAEDRIELALENRGPLTHNLISIVLRRVARDCGHEAANKLIEQYGLDALFGIHPVKSE